MGTSCTVTSGRCGHTTKIEGELNDEGNFSIKIESTCHHIKTFSKRLSDIQIKPKDVSKPILENPIYIAANRVVGPECVVPSCVVNVCWVEAGLVSKRLLARYPTTEIDYEISLGPEQGVP